MSFRRSSATRLRPIPANAFSTIGRRPADALQLQAGQGARGGARRARGGRAGRAARAAGDGARRDSRVQPAAVRHRAAARHSRRTCSRSRRHVDFARNRRAAGAATELEVLRAEVDLENQRAEAAARRERCRCRARAAEHGDAAPDDDSDRARPTRWRSCRFDGRCSTTP